MTEKIIYVANDGMVKGELICLYMLFSGEFIKVQK